jgi:two-component system chemotaxis response regulator CheB
MQRITEEQAPAGKRRSGRSLFDPIIIGTSMGGLSALTSVLAPLPPDFPATIIVAQHLPERRESYLPELLGRHSPLPVKWAESAQRLRASTVYLVPRCTEARLTHWRMCRLFNQPSTTRVRPPIDPLFASAAQHFGPQALAVVLTGRLDDGARGAAAIRNNGGVVIAQDPRTCVAPGMPCAAIARGVVDFVLPPEAIASALVSLVMVPGTAALFGVARSAA